MSNIPMKTLKLHGLDDIYTIPTAPEHIGAAPAGFGLGETFPQVTLTTMDAVDQCRITGFYRYAVFGSTVCNVEVNYGSLAVYTVYTGECIQELRPLVTNYLMRRWCGSDGVWSEWEIDNPPMISGIEYRTTERWNGSPVYAKGINIGYLAAGTHTIAHNCAVSLPLSLDFYNNNQELLNRYSNISNLTVDRTNINITCDNAFGNISVLMKYTKAGG